MKLLFFVVVVLSFSCSRVNFTGNPLSADQQIQSPRNPPICSGGISETTKMLRIIFMVDNSGSTATTDPNQIIRVQTIKNFLSKYSSKKNLTYGIGYFSDDTFIFNTSTRQFEDVTQSGKMPKNVFGDSDDSMRALSVLHDVDPIGSTNYRSALSAIHSMISNDPKSNSNWNYILVFMSDGQPSDIADPVISNLQSLIDSVTDASVAHGGLTTTSMVLFDPAADAQYFSSAQNLKAMADRGKGQFFDINKSPASGLVIDDIISIPGQSCN